MTNEPRLFSLYTRHWPALAGVVILLYALWVTASPETMAGGLFVMLLEFGVRAAATLAAQRALGRIENKRVLRVWRYIAAGLLIWTLADAVTILQWTMQATPPVAPSLRDLLQVAGYFSVLAGIVGFRTAQQESFGRVREALDIGILILGVLTLAWLVFLGPAVNAGLLQINIIFWLAIRPILDLVVLLLIVRLLIVQTQAGELKLLLLLLLAFGIFFVSDLSASMRGIYRYLVDPSLAEAGWMAGSLILGLAFRGLAGSVSALESHVLSPVAPWRIRLELLFPLVFTYAVVGFLLFDWWFSSSLDWAGVVGAGLLIAFMFARQGVIAGQQELRQFAALINAAADMAFICDLEGRVRLANPSLRNALGVPVDRDASWDLADVLEESSAGQLHSMLEQAQAQGWSGEVVFEGLNGTRFPASLEMRPLGDAQRSRTLIAGTAHDLAEIQKREDDLRHALEDVDLAREQLAQLNRDLEDKVEDRTQQLEHTVADLARLNEELKELDKLKSEFVALVSHELRSPLTNIRSGIELLLERDHKLAGRTRESLDLIQTETDRLNLFVETILDLSAIDAGRVQLELNPMPVGPLIRSTAARFPHAEDRIKINKKGLASLPEVLADRRALESVFFHVVDNALKYAPASPVTLAGTAEGGYVKIEISDQGPGIPEEERERVFEMFHRLDTRDARDVYGHGLGLPMARRLVEAMGGRIGITNPGTGGTLVWFTIPQAQVDETPDSVPNISDRAAGG